MPWLPVHQNLWFLSWPTLSPLLVCLLAGSFKSYFVYIIHFGEKETLNPRVFLYFFLRKTINICSCKPQSFFITKTLLENTKVIFVKSSKDIHPKNLSKIINLTKAKIYAWGVHWSMTHKKYCSHPEGSGGCSVKQGTSHQHYKDYGAKQKQLYKLRYKNLSRSGPSHVWPTWPGPPPCHNAPSASAFLRPSSSIRPQTSPRPAARGALLLAGHTGCGVSVCLLPPWTCRARGILLNRGLTCSEQLLSVREVNEARGNDCKETHHMLTLVFPRSLEQGWLPLLSTFLFFKLLRKNPQ